jgi:hypothetical protein
MTACLYFLYLLFNAVPPILDFWLRPCIALQRIPKLGHLPQLTMRQRITRFGVEAFDLILRITANPSKMAVFSRF